MTVLVDANSPLDKDAISQLFNIGNRHPQCFKFRAQSCRCKNEPHFDDTLPICGRLVLNCARIAFKLWEGGVRDIWLLLRLLSHRTIDDISQIVEICRTPSSDIDTLLTAPIFEEPMVVESKVSIYESLSVLLRSWFSPWPTTLSVIVLQNCSETISYLQIPFEDSVVYAVFDPHSRPGLLGPSLTLSSQIDDICTLDTFANPISSAQEVSARLMRPRMEPLFELNTDGMDWFTTLPANLCNDKNDLGKSTESMSTKSYPPCTASTGSNFSKPLGVHIPTPSNMESATFPRNKEKQTSYGQSCFTAPSLPWISNDEFTPYPFARPGSAPEIEEGSSRAGPSRLAWLESHSRARSWPERECSSLKQVFPTETQDLEAPNPCMEDDWEVALLMQLQGEEEIAASVPHRISSQDAWQVALQKYVLLQDKLNDGVSSFELDWQLAVQLQQEELIPRSGLHSQSTITSNHIHNNPTDPPESTFECGICSERHENGSKIFLVVCGHSYCSACVTALTRAKIEDNRYPIYCPDCLIDRSRANKCQITQDVFETLDLSSQELERLRDLQLRSRFVILECPRCNKSISIDRTEYGERNIITCSGLDCGHKWCKNCLKGLRTLEERHRCKNESIDRLMRRKGWKYCPGCRTPVQKESGCNHMTCSAPGCNAHFCYKCGVLIVDTTNGGDVGLTVTEHYANSKCRLFERRFHCTIQ